MTELKLIEQELDIINNMDDVLENDVNHNSSDDNDGSHIWMRELITESFDAAKTT